MCTIPTLKETHSPIVSEGDQPCVWMELGMVSYKICDRNFQCETCPLDIGLRGSNETTIESSDSTAQSRTDIIHPLRTALISRMVQPSRWANRFFHPRHFWMQTLDRERIRIGFDLIAASIIGSIEEIVLPEFGSSIKREGECGSFLKQGQRIRFTAPITGIVTAVNESLKTWPNRLSLEPMDEGWLFDVKPEALHADLIHCRRGEKIWPWYVNEILKVDNWLALQLPANGLDPIDEDALSEELQRTISTEEYRKLLSNVIGVIDSENTKQNQD